MMTSRNVQLLPLVLALALAAACGSEPAEDAPEAPPAPAPMQSQSAAAVSGAGGQEAHAAAPLAAAPVAAPSMPPVAADTEAAARSTTYNEHVQPILARACVSCHSDGQIAPFSLDTYERAATFAPLMAEATRSRAMPPSVVDNSGACNTYRDLPWLSDDEIATIGRWSEEGAPEGRPAAMLARSPSLPKLSGEVKTLKTPAYVPSTAKNDDWRCFVIASPITENTFVTGYDTRPGDQKTAHHMVVFYPMDDVSAALAQVIDDSEEGPGYTCFGSPSVPATVIAAWAPGGGATLYPDNLGVAIDANRPIIIQMHYNTMGLTNPGPDSTEIDLQTRTQGVQPGAFVNVLDLEMSLPPGRTDAQEVVETTVASKMDGMTGAVQVYGVFPHMHELGRTLTLSVERSGKQECMLDAPRYSFHWQRMYFFDKPITIDANDNISARCVFDTTSRMDVTSWGESTADEMCVAGMFVKL